VAEGPAPDRCRGLSMPEEGLRATVAAHLAPHLPSQLLLAALHEAGHAVMAAACGLPMASATARGGGGAVTADQQKARVLSARSRQRRSAPLPRAASIGAELIMMGWALGGACAVELRAAARPGAAWQPHASHYGRMSRSDWRGWYDGAEELRGLGVHAGQAAPALADWVDETLARHAPTLARLARVLLRRGRLTSPELDRLLAPVAADPEPMLRLIILAERLMGDPLMAWSPHVLRLQGPPGRFRNYGGQ